LEIGRRLLEREFKRHDLAPAQMFKSERLQQVARESGFDSTDEMTAAIGYGRLSTTQVMGRLIPAAANDGRTTAPPETPAVVRPLTVKVDDKGVKVQGGRDLLMQLSRCCNPVPGDRIMGYITRGRGLSIHSVGCPNLEALDYDKERLLEVEWDTTAASTHAVKVSVLTVDRTGVLANVSTAISECEANISRAEITTREDRKALLDFVIEVTNTAHLNRVLKAVERVEGVITARRIRAWQER
jgi:GTP pyrophosphokinase